MQHWHTVVPDLAMRVTLLALMGAGDICDRHTQDTPPCSISRVFSRFALISTTTATAMASSAVPTVLYPHSFPHLCISGYFVRGHFGSEVYSGSSMASASSSLVGGELLH